MSVALLRPYCTVADVQREAQNTSADDKDVFATEINKASRRIEEYCMRDFWFHDHSSTPLIVSPHWCALNKIYLPWPIITLTKVEVSEGPDSEWTELDATSYITEPATAPRGRAKIVRSGNWLRDDSVTPGLAPAARTTIPRRTRLTGTFGYALDGTNPQTTPPPGMPQEISTVCAVLAAVSSGLWRKEFTDLSGQRQSTTQRSAPKDVMQMLDRYRLPVV